MADKLYITTSFTKELIVTTTDDMGNEVPMDISKFDDNYIVFKKDRSVPDEEAYLIKRVHPSKTKKGVLNIHITPEETLNFPVTDENIPYIYMFVQIGCTGTGETIEVGAYKIKTLYAGMRYYSRRTFDFGDLGRIVEPVCGTFDAGSLCERATVKIDLSGGQPIVINLGYLRSQETVIEDLGYIRDVASETIDLGQISRRCSFASV